jgi:tetratricopeptide (TPR) repeat protein
MLDISIKKVIIPTYKTGQPDLFPMFYEKRVYQGSSGKVYPLPIIDKILDFKEEVEYEAVFLENEYLQIMVLPSLGGRIQRALDKTNQFDFVYYNEVIKPALVGLAGPWISGGIEFNWPQHHRPSTFSKVEFDISKSENKVSCHISEIDVMYGTKCHVTYTLHRGKAYIEIQGELYNKTDFPQTFLWWANPAVAVNDDTQSIFPPDVTAVYDHGKRDVSKFPIAKGIYYKVDYSRGVDISRYKNIPVPTSYMAYRSDYNFIGNYDYQKKAGLLHVANHHIAPGKKQWTWGNGHFGETWDQHLTDENGPYIELMTGVYTDNQPDFTWLAPKETKGFTQYFMPYKAIGEVKNANQKIAISVDTKDKIVMIGLYATQELENLKVVIKHDLEESVAYISSLSPIETKFVDVELSTIPNSFEVEILSQQNETLIHYENKAITQEIPEAAKKAPKPNEISSLDELYLTAVHLEQYRHATYNAEDYYLEGLKRDAQDTRLNTGYGRLLLQKGLFQESLVYFNRAISRLFRYNERPYDAEVLYYKALTKKYLNLDKEAYDLFYKASWSFPWKSQSYLNLAKIDLKRAIAKMNIEKHQDAISYINIGLEHINNGLVYNQNCMNSKALMITMLRLKGESEQAKKVLKQAMTEDPLNVIFLYEANILGQTPIEKSLHAINGLSKNLFEVAEYYESFGGYRASIDALNLFKKEVNIDPMINYKLAMNYDILGDQHEAIKHLKIAESMNDCLCFPNTIFHKIVLEYVIAKFPNLYLAPYLLGNLYYDKRLYQQAIQLWRDSIANHQNFELPHRNLGIGYFNKLKDGNKALAAYQEAISIKPNQPRLIYEHDQLRKRMHIHPKVRIKDLELSKQILNERDDLYLEYVTLLNVLERHDEALKCINSHRFHVWEGGEGKVREQFVIANLELAKKHLTHNPIIAIQYLEQALTYPENLGEGKLIGTLDAHLHYYLGLAYEKIDQKKSDIHYTKASKGSSNIEFSMFYNDQPVDAIFFQGLSLVKLNETKLAFQKFNLLLDYANQKHEQQIEIDYFAVSLPNYLIFDDDIIEKFHHFIQYIKALSLYGFHKKEEALSIYQGIIKENPSFQGYFNFKEST